MSIELTFVGYQDGIPIYMPINKKDQDALKGQSVIECNLKKKGTRTTKQNSALHLFLRKLADALNDAGLDMKAVLKPEVEIPWNSTTAKENLWRPVQLAMTQKESTADLDTVEVSQVYDALNRHIASKFGVSVPFPEIYKLLYEQEAQNQKV